MIVYGGVAPDGSMTTYVDGAAFDPDRNSWRLIPKSPVSGRYAAAAVWTGTEMIVWSGVSQALGALNDGAAFNPRTNSWRRLPASPLAGRSSAWSAWTGREMIIWGGQPVPMTDANFVDLDGAAYNPHTNTWRRLPAVPAQPDHPIAGTDITWTGSGFLVWSYWQRPIVTASGAFTAISGTDAAQYDLRSNAWKVLPALPRGLPTIGVQTFFTGRDIVTYGGDFVLRVIGPLRPTTPGFVYRPGANSVRPISGPAEYSGRSIWGCGVLLTLGATLSAAGWSENAVISQPTNGQWRHVAPYPGDQSPDMNLVWAGDRVFVWDAGSAWTYRFQAS